MALSIQSFEQPSPVSDRESRGVLYLITLGLCALTFCVFLQVARFDYINLDDPQYINAMVQKGLTAQGIKYAFVSLVPNYWHPLTWLSHMADCQFFGLTPGWHHLTSVILHTESVVVLFFFLHRLTGTLWRSAIVAALFAIHPLHVESVAWVSERKDVLSCLFWLLTMWMYVDYAKDTRSKRKYIFSVAFYLLAIMSKPTVVTLPLALLLIDYWPLKRLSLESFGARVKEKIPFFLLSGILMVTTHLGQKQEGALDVGHTEGIRIANALVSYVVYLRDLVWPQSLGVLYPFPLSVPDVDVVFSVTVLTVISAFVFWYGRKSRYLVVGWLWFLGVLVPMIGFVQVGPQARADRYTYISAIGIFVMVVWGVEEAAKRYRVPRKLLISVSAAVLIALAARSWVQVRYWKNGETLYTHTIAITGRNPVLKRNLGSILNNEHRQREAEPYYRSAIVDAPDFVDAYAGLGINLVEQREWEEGANALTRALQTKPDNPAAIYQRAIALSHLNRVPEAIQDFQDVLHYNLRPSDKAAAEESLGKLWLESGDNQAALTELNAALAINPDSVEARINHALALAALGRLADSFGELTRLRAAYPKDERVLHAWQDIQNRIRPGIHGKP